MKNEEAMRTIDFHAENPSNIQRKNLRIRLVNSPACKKVRITAAEKGNKEQNSKLYNKNAA